MKNLEEIKENFEHKSYAVRMEFINKYHFEDAYLEYYENFILTQINVKDPLYLSELIDLSSWLEINSKAIRARWFSYLVRKKHYIIKLAVLDYFVRGKKNLFADKYEKTLAKLLKGRQMRILRNQILLNLINLESGYKANYVTLLHISLEQTKDWRSIYRTILNMQDHELKGIQKHKKEIIAHIRHLHSRVNFGEGVDGLLKKM